MVLFEIELKITRRLVREKQNIDKGVNYMAKNRREITIILQHYDVVTIDFLVRARS